MNLNAWKSNAQDRLASEFQRELYCGMWLFVVAFFLTHWHSTGSLTKSCQVKSWEVQLTMQEAWFHCGVVFADLNTKSLLPTLHFWVERFTSFSFQSPWKFMLSIPNFKTFSFPYFAPQKLNMALSWSEYWETN